MKIFLCTLIVFLSGLIGINLKNEIHKKYNLFTEINAFLHFTYIKIAFFKDVYTDCLNNFITINKPKNKQFFNAILGLISANNLTRSNLQSFLKNYNLTPQERTLICDIFLSIGSTDLQNQKQILQGNINLSEQKINELNILKKTKGDMTAKLSICIGLVICILIF